MPEIMKFSMIDRSRSTKINFCGEKLRKKESPPFSKIFQLAILFFLFLWMQAAFQPIEARVLSKPERSKRTPFSLDNSLLDSQSGKLLFKLENFDNYSSF